MKRDAPPPVAAKGDALPGRRLSEADKSVWEEVARTVRPLRQKRKRRALALPDKNAPPQNSQAAPAARPAAAQRNRPVLAGSLSPRRGSLDILQKILPAAWQKGQDCPAAPPESNKPPENNKQRQNRPLLPPAPNAAGFGRFDRGIYRKLKQNRLPIDARLDLHDHSQQEAHGALLHFIRRASRRGLLHVLIITGKGRLRTGGGVLQKQVPHWLATAAFRPYIAAISPAARLHGGGGAFYLRLRKNKG